MRNKKQKEIAVERKSNIELLRIISMLLIIIFHCAYKSGFVFEEYFSMNKFLVKIFWMFGELGVNLFGLISGYHMIQGRFKHKKLILLTSEVFFYQIFTHVIACKVGIFQGGGDKRHLSSFISCDIKLLLVYNGICYNLHIKPIFKCIYICHGTESLQKIFNNSINFV